MSEALATHGRVFHTLDALRGIGAIGVVVFHMSALFTPIPAPGGYLAVDLFFMMSGVVLSNAYEARFRAGMGKLEFMRARIIRLYPLYLAGCFFGMSVVLASLHGHNSEHWDVSSFARAVMLALVILPDFSMRPVNEMFPLNIPCWSLFFEILVNLLFVVVWPLLTTVRLIVITLVTGGALALAIAHLGDIDHGSIGSSFGVGLARTVFGFSVGVLIARRIPRVHRKQNNLAVVAIVIVVCIAIGGWPQGEYRTLWDAVCVLMVFPVIVYFGMLIDPSSTLQRIATFLGVTSYAIYVLHNPLTSIINSATRQADDIAGVGAPYSGIAILALLLIGGWLIDRYFDTPIRRRLSRIIPKTHASRA